MLFVTESGASTELAVAGREACVGIGQFMGGESTPSRAIAQIAGAALRLRVSEPVRVAAARRSVYEFGLPA